MHLPQASDHKPSESSLVPTPEVPDRRVGPTVDNVVHKSNNAVLKVDSYRV